MKLNLTWWRKRPSVHVADYDARLGGFVDMKNVILTLDADTSHFTTMLDKLTNPGYVRLTLDAPLAVGSFIEHEGNIHRVETCKREQSDDWFAPDRWIVGARKPWVDPPVPKETLYRWLEDDFMPRLHSKPFNTKVILTNITDTYGA